MFTWHRPLLLIPCSTRPPRRDRTGIDSSGGCFLLMVYRFQTRVKSQRVAQQSTSDADADAGSPSFHTHLFWAHSPASVHEDGYLRLGGLGHPSSSCIPPLSPANGNSYCRRAAAQLARGSQPSESRRVRNRLDIAPAILRAERGCQPAATCDHLACITPQEAR